MKQFIIYELVRTGTVGVILSLNNTRAIKWSNPTLKKYKTLTTSNNLKITITKNSLTKQQFKSTKDQNFKKLFVPKQTKLSKDLLGRMFPNLQIVSDIDNCDCVLFTDSSLFKIKSSIIKNLPFNNMKIKYYEEDDITHIISDELSACLGKTSKFKQTGYLNIQKSKSDLKFINLRDLMELYNPVQNKDLEYSQFLELAKQALSKTKNIAKMATQAICSFDSSHNELKNMILTLVCVAKNSSLGLGAALNDHKTENIYLYLNSLSGDDLNAIRYNVRELISGKLFSYQNVYNKSNHPYIHKLMGEDFLVSKLFKIDSNNIKITIMDKKNDLKDMLL